MDTLLKILLLDQLRAKNVYIVLSKISIIAILNAILTIVVRNRKIMLKKISFGDWKIIKSIYIDLQYKN